MTDRDGAVREVDGGLVKLGYFLGGVLALIGGGLWPINSIASNKTSLSGGIEVVYSSSAWATASGIMALFGIALALTTFVLHRASAAKVHVGE